MMISQPQIHTNKGVIIGAIEMLLTRLSIEKVQPPMPSGSGWSSRQEVSPGRRIPVSWVPVGLRVNTDWTGMPKGAGSG